MTKVPKHRPKTKPNGKPVKAKRDVLRPKAVSSTPIIEGSSLSKLRDKLRGITRQIAKNSNPDANFKLTTEQLSNLEQRKVLLEEEITGRMKLHTIAQRLSTPARLKSMRYDKQRVNKTIQSLGNKLGLMLVNDQNNTEAEKLRQELQKQLEWRAYIVHFPPFLPYLPIHRNVQTTDGDIDTKHHGLTTQQQNKQENIKAKILRKIGPDKIASSLLQQVEADIDEEKEGKNNIHGRNAKNKTTQQQQQQQQDTTKQNQRGVSKKGSSSESNDTNNNNNDDDAENKEDDYQSYLWWKNDGDDDDDDDDDISD